jgi:CBS domain-containing protein
VREAGTQARNEIQPETTIMKDLNKITASDIMQTRVVTFTTSTPIDEAVQTFEDQRMSGAPVVNERGRLVGMLSLADVARPEHVKSGRTNSAGAVLALTAPDDDSLEGEMDEEEVVLSMDDYDSGMRDRPTVGDWMSTQPICVGPDWTLPRICRLMLKERIHRVPVVQAHELKGIVSTFDVVRCVAGKATQQTSS